MNILIVDDEKLIVDDLMHEVKEIVPGASIDGMTNSVGALERAREKEYDVALIDIDMPDMDGLTLARRLIAFSPAINIIFITGYGEYAIEAHELYCSAFLVKPVGNRKLKRPSKISEDLLLISLRNFIRSTIPAKMSLEKGWRSAVSSVAFPVRNSPIS